MIHSPSDSGHCEKVSIGSSFPLNLIRGPFRAMCCIACFRTLSAAHVLQSFASASHAVNDEAACRLGAPWTHGHPDTARRPSGGFREPSAKLGKVPVPAHAMKQLISSLHASRRNPRRCCFSPVKRAPLPPAFKGRKQKENWHLLTLPKCVICSRRRCTGKTQGTWEHRVTANVTCNPKKGWCTKRRFLNDSVGLHLMQAPVTLKKRTINRSKGRSHVP